MKPFFIRKMATSFGVHVGTSSTCVAVNKDGHTTVLANDVGDRVTPAVVSFNNGELSAGLKSRTACNNMENCVRLIGSLNLGDSNVADVINRSSCKITKGNGGELFYEPSNDDGKPAKKYTAQHVLTLIYKQLLETATSHSGIHGDRTAVLTVSLEFTDEQVADMTVAATSAGFNVLQVIREPAAALLAYEVCHNDCSAPKEEMCVVYRVGGTSLDATVVAIQNGIYRIVSSVHRVDLGGDEITKLLSNLFADEFKRRHKVDVTDKPRAMHKLRQAAEEGKRIVSTLTTTNCSVESLYDGIDFTCSLSRSRLEILLNNVLPQFLIPLEEVLEMAELNVDNVDKVILCGGTCKIPQLQQAIIQFFKSSVEVMCHLPPDEALAIGAANQAMYLLTREANLGTGQESMFPTVARSIYYRISETNDKQNKRKLVFKAGTIVPARYELVIPLTIDDHGRISIDVFEDGDEDDENEFNLLAKMTFSDLPKNVVDVTAHFEANGDNSLRVCLSEKLTGKSESVVISGGLN